MGPVRLNGLRPIIDGMKQVDVALLDGAAAASVSDALGYIGLINNVDFGSRSDTPYGKNALVRRALDAAIDRTALVNVVFNANVPPVAPNSPFYDETLTPPPRDLAKASALLRQAGVTPPLTLELITPNQPDSLQAAEVIQSMAADAGFNIRIVAMEITAAGQIPQRGDYQFIWTAGLVASTRTAIRFSSCRQVRATTLPATAIRRSTGCSSRDGPTDTGRRRVRVSKGMGSVAA
jgi:ABC-type transport system substrate-binding protein